MTLYPGSGTSSPAVGEEPRSGQEADRRHAPPNEALRFR